MFETEQAVIRRAFDREATHFDLARKAASDAPVVANGGNVGISRSAPNGAKRTSSD
ncbi:hypothetical protein [Acetobacter fallax]|uniref:Uncharacterized protein n=1 Tax=Acetobacter fallax TaxID=1737473 RepID=A0ABX0KBS7_9PROT|nr:hypothetical protein [Acetobacter fallax]NHO33874.1 hypothetical protein [Acetobacter fallax]NHO37444.1 hypothetical protein [Acetobacter fallax]